jgi:hypothetical protein
VNMKILALVTALSLMTSATIVSNLTQAVIAKNNDKCITTKNKDKTSSSTICVTGDHGDSIKDLTKVCKVYTNSIQCSTSQKGNGISGNFNITQTQTNSP